MSDRKFIRINDKFIRFDKIQSIEVKEWFATDSMAEIALTMGNFNSESIILHTPEWMPEDECAIYLRPKINKLVDFIEDAINGKLVDYYIEFE